MRGMRQLALMAAMTGLSGYGFPVETDHQRRARERRYIDEDNRRFRREAREREEALRQRIAKGEDNRADKYLHSAARRRRQQQEG